MTITQCSSCGADIFWVKTQRGARAPLNAAAVTGFELEQVDAAGHQTVGPLKRVYVSHFATCPHANQHRRSNQ